MAGISSDILTSLMRSNLNNLKSFAEQTNAELTEDEHEHESRDQNRRRMLQILQKFGEAEAYFEKAVNCLEKVDKDVKKNCPVDNSGEQLTESAVFDEILTTMNALTGKERIADTSDNGHLNNSDENGIRRQMEGIQEILSELHPIQLEDENEDIDTAEESRMVRQLEAMQKRALAKSMRRMSAGDGQEAIAEAIDDSDEEELNIAANSFERAGNTRHDKRSVVDTDKFKELWNNFKKGLVNGSNIDPKQIFDEKIDKEAEISQQKLPLLSKYHDKILELFSKEAIVVLEQKQNYTDPISKTAIQNPVRNKLCEHIYERDTIYSILKKKKSMACPCMGCSCRSFTLKDLEDDEETAAKISQNRSRQQCADEDAENASTDEEIDPEDDTQSQEIL